MATTNEDMYAYYGQGWTAPYRNAVAVTPDDTADLSMVSRALWVGTSGDVAVVMAGGTSTGPVTFKNVQIGTLLRVRVSRVLLTGSSLTTGILSLW